MFENLMKWVSSRAVRATEARVNGMGGPNPCLNLADARQGKGITLEEIARSTKIDLRILQAIEAENFAKLPGGLYGTSFIRQYAQTIGYEESVVLDHYFSKMELEPTDGMHPTTKFGPQLDSNEVITPTYRGLSV